MVLTQSNLSKTGILWRRLQLIVRAVMIIVLSLDGLIVGGLGLFGGGLFEVVQVVAGPVA